jgi:hypothetical protein
MHCLSSHICIQIKRMAILKQYTEECQRQPDTKVSETHYNQLIQCTYDDFWIWIWTISC